MNRTLYSPMFTVHTYTCRRPISACWYVTTPVSVEYHPVDHDPTDQPTPAPSYNFTCRVMNDVFFLEPMSFPTAGQYVFVAVFHNSASQANNTISFEVVQGEWFLVCSIVFKIHCSMHTQISIGMHELLHVECTLGFHTGNSSRIPMTKYYDKTLSIVYTVV